MRNLILAFTALTLLSIGTAEARGPGGPNHYSHSRPGPAYAHARPRHHPRPVYRSQRRHHNGRPLVLIGGPHYSPYFEPYVVERVRYVEPYPAGTSIYFSNRNFGFGFSNLMW